MDTPFHDRIEDKCPAFRVRVLWIDLGGVLLNVGGSVIELLDGEWVLQLGKHEQGVEIWKAMPFALAIALVR
jgi:hypothetical protein